MNLKLIFVQASPLERHLISRKFSEKIFSNKIKSDFRSAVLLAVSMTEMQSE